MRWRIGLIGFGNVGRAFIKLYKEMHSYWAEKYELNASFHYVLNSKGGISKKDGIDLNALVSIAESNGRLDAIPGWKEGLTFNDALEQSSTNLLVEVSPTNIMDGEPALSRIITALAQGISVAAGNKGPFLFQYKNLVEIAKKHNLLLGTGCASGAALPTINFGKYSLAGSKITRIEGILNGVCNFILTRMEGQSTSFDQALHEAQARGIAETDPSYDIEGWDTAAKIIIISNTLMDTDLTLKDIAVEGLRNIGPELIFKAKQEQKRIKLIGFAENPGENVKAGVALQEFDSSNVLYHVMGTRKMIIYHTEPAGQYIVEGGASSPIGAAYALWRDILLNKG
jgi:homoserine dehydrogenase